MPKPRRRNTKQPNTASNKQQKATNSERENSIIAPLLVQLASEIRSFVETYQAAQESKNSNTGSQFRWARWTAIFTGLGFLAAGIYACISYRQWRDADANFVADQRSWANLGVAWPEPPLLPNVAFGVRTKTSNGGRTPIIKIYTDSFIELTKSANPPSFNLSQYHSIGHHAGFLFPSQQTAETASFLWDQGTKQQRALSVDEIAELLNGSKYIAFYGVINYLDSFGPHWYAFCYWKSYSITSAARFNADACVVWNAAGDGNLPDKYRNK